jgi:hypothetical protein
VQKLKYRCFVVYFLWRCNLDGNASTALEITRKEDGSPASFSEQPKRAIACCGFKTRQRRDSFR